MGMMRSQGGGGGLWNNHFPNPFLDIASMAMPQSLKSALYWAEYLWLSQGTYRSAMERLVSYFITDVEISGDEAGDDEKDKWKQFMTETIGITTEIQNALRNRLCYGNSMISIISPFKRFLRCPKCGSSYPLSQVYSNSAFNFTWDDMHFVASCPTCKVGSGFRGRWRVDDKPDNEERKLRIKHWSPHEIEILHDYYTDETAYLWRIPEDYKAQVRRGHLFHLERVSQPLMDAIRNGRLFRFNPDALYHMKEPTLGGVRNRGWGIPRTLTNFRQIYYVQVLRRYNEAIALDYVMPFRLLTPMPRGGGMSSGSGQAQDPLMSFGGADIMSSLRSMLRRRKKDPCAWHVLPFPVNAQFIGGDASKLAPRDLLDQGNEELLTASNIPVDIYKGTLQLQAAPPALRLFEATNGHMVFDANAMLRWFVRQISQIMSWEIIDPKLKRVTIADDMSQTMARLQLMMGQQISGTTGLTPLGIDWKEEQRRQAEEAKFQAEEQAKTEEEMQQSGFAQQMAKGMVTPGPGGAPQTSGPGGGNPAAGGGGGGGGDPSQGGAGPAQGPVDQYLSNMGPNTPVQPQDMMQAADTIAQGLMGQPEGVKDSQLRLLKGKNEVMHSLVKSRMDAIRSQAKTQGGAAMIQQQFGQGQGGGGGGGGGQ